MKIHLRREPPKEDSTILIVDDDPIILNLLACIAAEAGYTILQAKNGKEALQQIKQNPDLVLLDIQLPDLNGFEIARSIKMNSTINEIAIIMITSETDSKSLRKAFRAGAEDYVVKPPKRDELLARISSVLTLKFERDIRRKRELELENLSQKLSKYLSPQVYKSIFKGQTEVEINTVNRKLTVFFSQIDRFTTLTDLIDPNDCAAMLNEYLAEMSDIALRHGGTIDNFFRGAISIFFGAPESAGVIDDAINCLKMAIEMRNCLFNLNKKWHSQGIAHQLNVKMGINTGNCTVGNFGNDKWLDYTIIGNQVNLSTRLSKYASDDQILIPQSTFMLVKNKIKCNPIQLKKIEDTKTLDSVYEVVDLYANLDLGHSLLKEEIEGFSLEIDFKCMKKKEAMAALQTIAKKIKKLPVD